MNAIRFCLKLISYKTAGSGRFHDQRVSPLLDIGVAPQANTENLERTGLVVAGRDEVAASRTGRLFHRGDWIGHTATFICVHIEFGEVLVMEKSCHASI